MKKILFTGLVGLLGVCLLGTPASALTYTFGDSVNYWDGWQNGSLDDTRDTIGIPNILGGEVTIDDSGYLQSIKIELETWENTSAYGMLKPGDLFLDFGSDQEWDYVVYMGQDQPALYSGSLGLNAASGYRESGSDNSGYWAGYNIRNDHAIGIAGTDGWSYESNVGFSGWGSSRFLTFSFSDFYVGGHDFTLGWALNCANDVIYESIEPVNPVPEPSTVLLLGAGLMGIVAIGRKKLQK